MFAQVYFSQIFHFHISLKHKHRVISIPLILFTIIDYFSNYFLFITLKEDVLIPNRYVFVQFILNLF